jgi:hypothetical protein
MKKDYKLLSLAIVTLLSFTGCEETTTDSEHNGSKKATSGSSEFLSLSDEALNVADKMLNGTDEVGKASDKTVDNQTTDSSSDSTTKNNTQTVDNQSGDDEVASSSSDSSQNCCNTPQSQIIGSAQTLNNAQDLSHSLLLNSIDLLKVSQSLIESGTSVDLIYVRAMLDLSHDILSMSDKIGQMSDRILIMSDKIGDMSERIIETQNIQNENVRLTEQNIIQAKKNLNSLLN